jgi:hypothetical protein
VTGPRPIDAGEDDVEVEKPSETFGLTNAQLVNLMSRMRRRRSCFEEALSDMGLGPP